MICEQKHVFDLPMMQKKIQMLEKCTDFLIVQSEEQKQTEN